jgi:HEAT repeat protein
MQSRAWPGLCGILLAVMFLVSRPVEGAEDTAALDDQFLRAAKVQTDAAGLLDFFVKHSLTPAQQEQLVNTVRQLGSPTFRTRSRASLELIAVGPPARPALRGLLRDADIEVARRAEFCLEEINRRPDSDPAVPSAAIRLLALRKPAASVRTLLLYAPFNDDESVEEELLTALKKLGFPKGMVDPCLPPLLQDPSPARRAAAAYVLGRSVSAPERAEVRKLLADTDPRVRLRAAQGLVAGKDKSGVPILIALLGDSPLGITWKAEELLYRMAGERAPTGSLGDGSPPARQKYRDLWADWWRRAEPLIDLARLEEGPQYLGLTLLAELNNNRIVEYGPDGRVRWKLDQGHGIQGPMDAQMLPGGRVLIAEYQGQRVTERDLQGKIHWSKQVQANPITCQRLANGNTFIATHQNVIEVTRDGREVYNRNLAGGQFLFAAQKLPNGRIICIANPGTVQECEASTGRIIRTFQLGNNLGGWCGIEGLRNGRYLVAVLNSGKVMELDETGKTRWECSVPGASFATRLPNGHTLVSSLMNRKVVEVDRTGKTVKEMSTDGQPWRVHRR